MSFNTRLAFGFLFFVLAWPLQAYTPERIEPSGHRFEEHQKARLELAQKLLKEILAVKGPRNLENTLLPFRELSTLISNAFSEASLYSNVHPEQIIREYAFQNLQDLSQYYTQNIELNQELYLALSQVKLDKPSPELKRYYDELIRNYKREGVDRDEATRQKIAALKQEITEASQSFSRNLREDVRSIMVKPEDLKGLPNDYIKPRLLDNGYVKITTDYPDSGPVFNYAESSAIRFRLFTLARSRGYPANQKALKTLLEKRHQLASLLGYKNWAEYATEDKMIQTPTNADRFIDEIANIARSRAKQEYELFLQEKRRHEANATALFEWERAYFVNQYKKRVLNFDPQEIRPYFAYDQVRDGVFKISEKLFGIEIRPVKGVDAWHQDVSIWDVYDGKQHLGRFYLDMFPREHKFKHAAQFTLRSGVKGLQLPHAVLVCNFPQPSANDPALMEHRQVETFLHEFGHLLHAIFRGHNEWQSSVEWDFIEVPSIMLEEWTWNQEALHLFARHYENKKLISPQLIEKMRSARTTSLGLETLIQLQYARLSLDIYNRNPQGLDIDSLNREVHKRYSLFNFTEQTYFPYSFGHLTGYASNYYTYMWSSVIAADLYSQFAEKGIFSGDVAKNYRHKVLAATGTMSANELVKQFLGRPYSPEAFQQILRDNTLLKKSP